MFSHSYHPLLSSVLIVLLSVVPIAQAITPQATELGDIDGHTYEEAITFLVEEEIVGGYDDGTYRPDNTLNRAELLKIIVEAVYEDEFESYSEENCYSDVPSGEWYTPYVCYGTEVGIVEGYEDGTFRPAQEVNYVEALKMSLVGFGFDYTTGDPWYKNLVITAGENFYISYDIQSADTLLTRAQMAEMITRILKDQTGELFNYIDEIDRVFDIYEDTAQDPEDGIPHMLNLINWHRTTHGVFPLQMDEDMNASVQEHAQWMYDNETMSHEDDEGKYAKDRCVDDGITCIGENLATSSIHSAIFVFEMWRDSEGHNANMLDEAYTEIGLGIKSHYYATIFR